MKSSIRLSNHSMVCTLLLLQGNTAIDARKSCDEKYDATTERYISKILEDFEYLSRPY